MTTAQQTRAAGLLALMADQAAGLVASIGKYGDDIKQAQGDLWTPGDGSAYDRLLAAWRKARAVADQLDALAAEAKAQP